MSRNRGADGGLWNHGVFRVGRGARRRGPARRVHVVPASRVLVELLEERTLLAAPVLQLSGGAGIDRGTLQFVDGSGPLVLVPPVATLDTDSNLVSAQVTIDLAADDPANIVVDASTPEAFRYDLATIPGATATQTVDAAGKLTLSFTMPGGGVSAQQMLNLLESVVYANTISPPTATTRGVTVTVTNATGPNSPAALASVAFPGTPNQPPTSTGTAVQNTRFLVGTTTPTAIPGLAGVNYDPVELGQTLHYQITTLPITIGTVRLPGGAPAATGTDYTLGQIQGLQFEASTATTRGSGVLTFQVIDNGHTLHNGQDTLNQSLTITLNTAPTLGQSTAVLPGLLVNPATNPGSTVLALATQLQITEPGVPAAPQGVAVTGVTGNGNWYFSTNGGSSWNALTPTGPAGATLLAATTQDLVQFRPAAGFNGVATLTALAWDQSTGLDGTTGHSITSTGGTSAFSNTSATATLEVNTAPTLTGNGPALPSTSALTGSETSSLALNTLVSQLSITDPDPSPLKGIAITGMSGTGVWSISTDSGQTWQAITPSTAAAVLLGDAASNRVRFAPTLHFNGTASITYHAWDQVVGTNGGTADLTSTGQWTSFSTGTATSTLIVNAPPVVALNGGPVNVTEGAGPVSVAAGGTVTQPDNLTNYSGGTFTASITSPSPNPATTPGSPSPGQLQLVSNANVNLVVDASHVVWFNGNRIGTEGWDAVNLVETVRFDTTDATPAAVTAVLQSLQYVNVPKDPVHSLLVHILVDNGHGGGLSTSAPVDQSITINRVNNPPSLTVPSSSPSSPIRIVENVGSPIPVAIPGTFNADDPDAEGGLLKLDLGVSRGKIELPGYPAQPAAASLSISATLAELKTILSQGVKYTSNAGATGADALTLQLNDNGNTGDPNNSNPLTATASVNLLIVNGISLVPTVTVTTRFGEVVDATHPAIVGEDLTYTVTVTNNSPGFTASGVVLQVQLPNSMIDNGSPFTTKTINLGDITSVAPASSQFVVHAGPSAAFTTVIAQLTASDPAGDSGTGQGSITVGTATVSFDQSSVQETPGQTLPVVATVQLVPPAGTTFARVNPITINIASSGDANAFETDFTGTIPASVGLGTLGHSSQSFTLQIPDNNIITPTRTLTLSISVADHAGSDVRPPGPSNTSATLSILDGNGQSLNVTTTADNGSNASPTVGSLRAAIVAANGSSLKDAFGNYVAHTITFSSQLPVGSVFSVLTPLPTITQPVTIAAPASQSLVLDGTGGTAATALTVSAVNTTDPNAWSALGTRISGLTIRKFSGYAIEIIGSAGAGGYVQVVSNQLLNNGGGIKLNNAAHNTIGAPTTTPGAGNLIAGSAGNGLWITGSGSTANVVQGNTIGLSTSANAGYGVLVDAGATGNTIGADRASFDINVVRPAGNTIAHNGLGGVDIASVGANAVRGNSILQNNSTNATNNGIIVTGPGTVPPKAVLSAATYVGGKASIRGTITSSTGNLYLDVYANPVTNPSNPNPNPSPVPEGAKLIFTKKIDPNSTNLFDSFDTPDLAALQFVTVTLTDAAGNTSVFSDRQLVTNGLVVTTDQDDATSPITGSLRDAINNLNAGAPGTGQIITFAIVNPSSSPWTIQLQAPLPDIGKPLTINGAYASANGTGHVVLDGSLISRTSYPDAAGLHFTSGSGTSDVTGLVIRNFAGAGLRLSADSGFQITGNDIEGDRQGVLVDGASGVTIGGPGDSDRNIISGNTAEGVRIQTTTVVTTSQGKAVTPTYRIENNLIGVDSSGIVALHNGGDAIALDSSNAAIPYAPSVTIAGNTITSATYGIHLWGRSGVVQSDSGVSITGNLVGVAIDTKGTLGTKNALIALPTGFGGILLDTVSHVTIGGANTSDGNIIAASQKGTLPAGLPQGNGIALKDVRQVRVVNNTIGGTGDLGNAADGILVDPSDGVDIVGNTVSGSAENGIHVVDTTNARVAQNTVGTGGVGNALDGILVENSPGATIGSFSTTVGAVTVNYTGNTVTLSGLNGIEVDAGSNDTLVRGNTVTSSTGDGILVVTALRVQVSANTVGLSGKNGIHVNAAGNAAVWSNLVGVNATGASLPNTGDGVLVEDAPDVVVGGPTADDGNVVGLSRKNGIEVTGTASARVQVRHNLVGIDTRGTTLGNTGDGIRVSGSALQVTALSDTIDSNTVANTQGNGIDIVNAGSITITANRVGTDANGVGIHGNALDGILLVDLIPGGTASTPITVQNNVVSSNAGYGLDVRNVSHVLVSGNLIGTGGAGNASLGNGTAVGTPPTSYTGGGVHFEGTSTVALTGIQLRSNTISANKGNGVEFRYVTSPEIGFNWIGLDSAGSFALPNQGDGVALRHSTGARVLSNLVGGNTGNGISLAEHSDDALLQGNVIGSDANGRAVLGNTGDGVKIDASDGIVIGGTTSTLGNAILNNQGHGIEVSASANLQVIFNQIGVGGVGTGADSASLDRGNTGDGVSLSGVTGALFVANVIGSNRGNGIQVAGGSTATITSIVSITTTLDPNIIGGSRNGSLALGNRQSGVLVTGAGSVATIGQSRSDHGPDNILFGNSVDGVRITAGASGTVTSNLIGTNTAHVTGLGNVGAGIHVVGVSGVAITLNRIGGNLGDGIKAEGSTSLTVKGNWIGAAVDQPGWPDTNVRLPGNGLDGILLIDLVSGGSTTATTAALIGGSNLDGNRIDRNGTNGIEVRGSVANVILSSNVVGDPNPGPDSGNVGDGVHLENASGASLLLQWLGDRSSLGQIPTSGLNTLYLARISGVLHIRIFDALGRRAVDLDETAIPPSQAAALAALRSQLAGTVSDAVVRSVTSLVGYVSGVAVVNNTIAANRANGIQVIGSVAVPSQLPFVVEGNTVGGVYFATGNRLDGLRILNSSGVLVDRSNTFLGNRAHGVELSDGAHDNTIGPLVVDPSNPMSGGNSIQSSGGDGVQIGVGSANNTVQGNLIGNPATTSIDLGNIGNGLTVYGNTNTVAWNLIAGNHNSGVLFSGAGSYSNTLQSNTIGGIPAGNYQSNGNNGITLASTGTSTLPGNTIVSNTILGNHGNGILALNSNNTKIQQNCIGTDRDGTANRGNTNIGVFLSDSASSLIDHNVIAGNVSHGVLIQGSKSTANVLTSNLIGVTAPITIGSQGEMTIDPSQKVTSLPNQLSGVLILGATGNFIGQPGAGNVIAANLSHGVFIVQGKALEGQGNRVQGNTIGTDRLNTLGLGNKGNGVLVVDSSGNLIGGGAPIGEGNRISANSLSGVELLGASNLNDVQGNVIGTDDVAGAPGLGNGLHGVQVAGAGWGVVIDRWYGGNLVGGANSTSRGFGNVIGGNADNGVLVDSSYGTNVVGNWVGVTPNGTAIKNSLDGISLNAASLTNVSGNQVAFNNVDGITLHNSPPVPAAGAKAQPASAVYGNTIWNNDGDGIRIEENSHGNIIGTGLAGAAPNVIYNNASAGIEIRTGSKLNQLGNNIVGLAVDSNGNPVVPRPVPSRAPQPYGVYLNNVSGNVVGTTTLGRGSNLITGNARYDVWITGNQPSTSTGLPDGNQVVNNYIGTGALGTKLAIPGIDPVHQVGVFLYNSVNNTLAGNVVSGHTEAGIELYGNGSTRNTLFGNIVGSTADKTAAILPGDGTASATVYSARDDLGASNRQLSGIWLNDAPVNTIGLGQVPSQAGSGANVVLGNYIGIRVSGANAQGNIIAGNQVGPDATAMKGIYAQGNPTDSTYGYNVDGRGNYYGVWIDGTSFNQVYFNDVRGNASVGVGIVGTSAQNNWVYSNWFYTNGAYASRTTDGTSTTISLTGWAPGPTSTAPRSTWRGPRTTGSAPGPSRP